MKKLVFFWKSSIFFLKKCYFFWKSTIVFEKHIMFFLSKNIDFLKTVKYFHTRSFFNKDISIQFLRLTPPCYRQIQSKGKLIQKSHFFENFTISNALKRSKMRFSRRPQENFFVICECRINSLLFSPQNFNKREFI